MNESFQKAIINYSCKNDFLRFIEYCLENKLKFDYFPLCLFISLKIVQLKLYEQWNFVIESLEASVQVCKGTFISALCRTARFNALLMVLVKVKSKVF